MKNKKYIYSKITWLLSLVLIIILSCERPISDDVEFATFPATAEIFIDGPVGLGTDFYFPFLGSKPTAWSVDDDESYLGSSSMRFDVPNANDPEGNFAGAIFRIDGEGSGRDLSGFDALTFWAKATQAVTIGEVGFGTDFGENKFQTVTSIDITTNWIKYTIPIPDASKLIRERGMLWYAAGGVGNAGSEVGYTFWFDEVKFEKLGTIGQPQPAILNGVDVAEGAFKGTTIDLADLGLTQTFNLASGQNKTVNAAPSYFTFTSTDIEVARVNELGLVSIVGDGTATITATMGGVRASGSLTIETLGQFNFAPTPTLDPSRVISIFSDVYTNVNVDFFNGFWQPFQTTLSADFVLNGDNILSYTNFNFVGNQFSDPTIDATDKSTLHLNMFIPGDIPSNLDFLISVVDFGADAAEGGGDDTRQQIFFNGADFVVNEWSTLEANITLPNRNNIGLIIYENINGSSLESFYLDNIYFHN